MIAFLIAVACVAAFCFGVGGFLFFAACGKWKKWDWLDEAAVAKTPYGQYNKLIQKTNIWLAEHNAKAVELQNREGLRLHGLWIPAENPRGTIILAHGYHSGIYTDFGFVYDRYHKAGLNILVPDQRCHDKSEGKFVTFGVKESGDFLEWAKFHNDHLGSWPIVFSGLSMGASTTMYVAGQEYPANTVGFIVDCGFTSPREIIGAVFKQVTKLPAWPFLWATDLFARAFAGFRLADCDSTVMLKNNTLPIIFVHGLADDFVPCDMTKQSYEACGGPKELLLVEGAGHGVSFVVAEKEYEALVMAFFDRVLGEKE